ncbi:hypothetical protein AX769_05670 [Frondihabitans sp. PAMC 28766]|nr:hypothetical protein AX769_05670 [Frondihabitans sp. PAMC 28766]
MLQPGTKAEVTAADVVPAGEFVSISSDHHVTHRQVWGTLPRDFAPSSWSALRVAASSRVLPIHLAFGDCGERHHERIYVHETSATVLIDVWDGPTTDNPVGACAGTELEVPYLVHLKAPLGTRSLLTHEIVHA